MAYNSMGAFHGLAPSAPTSASKRTRKHAYDVFINHRGPDVKHTLASLLYGILTGVSLSVFLDSKEFEYGDFLPRTIEAAMKSAFLHIAIFSQRYAESPWCLAELSFMLKSGATIIPIFYYVDPTDLRWVDQGKGKYVQAFKGHEQKGRYSPEQLQEWKKALHVVSFYHGQIIESDKDETMLLKNIVSCVVKEINEKLPLEVAKHPVGLKEIVEDFKANTLQSAHGNQDAQIVGIWGMGGSGKTTLAKELYNEISSSMERSSFVFDVRDAATKGLLHEKQKKLLNDFGVQSLPFDNFEEGMRRLSRGLRSVRVLIVLDDVDNMEQLDALLPTKDSLQKGSLVIVTTRVCDVLKSWGISFIYKVRQLDPLYAKQLFCWHVFLKSSPPDGYNELVEKFLKVCNGLPLCLKVFGAQLYGELRKEYWESQLHKISRILPDDIKERLKISYDTLDDEEKEMFLDTACFFIGQESILAIEVWNGLGWSGLRSWERLLDKCLVELDNDNHIRMHDQFRDLGRDIAHKQSPHRLWFPQQIINIQRQENKRTSIQGIIATSNQIEWNIYWKGVNELLPAMIEKNGEVDQFRVCCSHGELMINTSGGIWPLAPSLIGLKYLVISGDYFNQVINEISRVLVWPRLFRIGKRKLLSEISKDLVWLRWFRIGQRNLPSGLSLKKLRILELCEKLYGEEHHLEELWKETDDETPVQLRYLLISGCTKFQGFPKSIGHLNHLKKIVITDGYNLTNLPDEFCLLQSLEHLVLHRCEMLSSVPNNFGNLSNLRHLTLLDCHELRRLPVSFRNLMLLEHLNLQGCCQLTFTAEDLNFLENISKLEFLNLSYCKQLVELPRHITNQASLKELYFSHTSLRELPYNFGQLSRLTEMKIADVLLTSLPNSLGDLSSLTNLQINNCNILECLPDSLGDLSSLMNLQIENCHRLRSLPKSIRQLSNLQELTIFCCPIRELDFGAASLPCGLSNLKKIILEQTEVCRISFSEHCCPHLESLHVFRNHHLKEIKMLNNIPSFRGLTSLREFHLQGCYSTEKIEGLENCTNLQALTVNTFWEVPGIESLERMQNLKCLHLQANKGLGIERCIQTVQKWPEEIMICARAVPDASLLVHSSLSLNLVILGSISNQDINSRPNLVLKSPSNGDTFMFCFVINCVSSPITLRCVLLSQENTHLTREYRVMVSMGRWVLAAVFTQLSRYPKEVQTEEKFSIQGMGQDCGEVEKGLVVRVEEQITAEAFHNLLPLFES